MKKVITAQYKECRKTCRVWNRPSNNLRRPIDNSASWVSSTASE